MDEKYVARRNEEHEEKKKKRKGTRSNLAAIHRRGEAKTKEGEAWKKSSVQKKKKEEGIKIKNRYICSDADGSFHGRNSSDRDIRVESEISRLPRAFNERSKTIRC